RRSIPIGGFLRLVRTRFGRAARFRLHFLACCGKKRLCVRTKREYRTETEHFSEEEESTMEKEILQDAVGLGVVITIIAAALVWGAFV
ncbi:MAG: hypothetical protein AAFY04_08660, partial [Pseudomonadota bacterium]